MDLKHFSSALAFAALATPVVAAGPGDVETRMAPTTVSEPSLDFQLDWPKGRSSSNHAITEHQALRAASLAKPGPRTERARHGQPKRAVSRDSQAIVSR